MEKLNQIIESMALAQYKAETKTTDQRNAFMLEHATLAEFFDYFSTKKTGTGDTWLEQYGYCTLGGMQGLTETFCKEVLWPKLKDKYIEDVVKNLESKLETTYKITIEQV
jgi:hypothetical protein